MQNDHDISLFEFSGASSSPSLSRKGSLNLDRFNFSLSSADERYSISHGATGGSKIPNTSEVRSENQSLLGAVEPLDWLFSADSEPEPPSSPKWVNKSLTDDDSKQESAACKGAIPKRPRVSDQTNKHPSDATDSNEDLTKDEDYDKARFNRKTQKRRPPTPPTSVSGGATAGSHADVVAASNDLRQRILEILGNFIKCRVG